MQQSAFLEDFAADVRDLLAREGETTEASGRWARGCSNSAGSPACNRCSTPPPRRAPPSTATPAGPSCWAARDSAPAT